MRTFSGLRPSDASGYTVTETQPDGYQDGRDATGTAGGTPHNDVFTDVVLTPGESASDYLFGELRATGLSGFVYADNNDDRTRSAGEPGIPGTVITVTGTDFLGSAVNEQATTASDGSYEFANLSPSGGAGYTLTETQPAGFLNGSTSAGSVGGTVGNDVISGILLSSGTVGSGFDFGELKPASIAGSVYVDSNDNGTDDVSESAIAGVAITLTGVNDLGAPVSLVATTNVNGSYSFGNLRPAAGGGYTVTETQPAGFLDGKDALGDGGGAAGNDVLTGISLHAGDDAAGYDFGELVPASISGVVFSDTDADGDMGAGEPGVSGTTITLTGTDDLGNAVNLTTSSASDGTWRFINLRPSDALGYRIAETLPDGVQAGLSTVGSAGGQGRAAVFAAVPLRSGTAAVGYEFAQLPADTLSIYSEVQGVQTPTAPGPYVVDGTAVAYAFVIVNTYSSTATIDSLVDEAGSLTITCPSDTVAPNSSLTCTATSVATPAAHLVAAELQASNGSTPVTAVTNARYFGAETSASLTSRVDAQDATTAPGPSATGGSTIDLTLTNTGLVPLAFTGISSGSLGPFDCGGLASLAAGGVAHCSATVSTDAVASDVTVTAHFSGPNLTDSDGTVSANAVDPTTEVAFVVTPTVSSVAPADGPTSGGTSVLIAGSNFTGANSVHFGSVSATFTVLSPTLIRAVTPPAADGTVDVRVAIAGETSAVSAADRFTFHAAPTITAVAPNRGSAAGGRTVTITGSGFTGASVVRFGTTSARSFTIVSDTQITAVSPNGLGTVDVTVTADGGTSATSSADSFTYVIPPTITSVSPSEGPTGGETAVTIIGTDLGTATDVTFGATPATSFTIDSATQITAISPSGTGSVDVAVTTVGGTTSSTVPDLFTFVSAPSVTSLTPASGWSAGGTTVTILGTDYIGATAVLFGTEASSTFVVNSPTSITAISPAGMGTVDVTVSTAGGTSATTPVDQFTYRTSATITSVSPSHGPVKGGTIITITGTGFTDATAVTVGGLPATSFTVTSATSITATTPAGSTGAADVVVTTPAGLSTAATFSYDPPSVVGLPGNGPLLGLTGADPVPGLLAALALLMVGGALIVVRRLGRGRRANS